MMKRLKTLMIAVVFSMTLLATTLGNVALSPAKAADDKILFQPASTGLTNGNFDAGSGSPATPDGWTGAAGTHANASVTVSGAIDLKTESFLNNYKDYKLDKQHGHFDEELPENDPRKYPRPNDKDSTKALLINNTGASAYKYSSSSLTLAANSYYLVNVSVLTGGFAQADGGAFISLDGDINMITKPISTNYTWQTYQMLIATDTMKTATSTLNLSVGLDRAVTDSKNFFETVDTRYNVDAEEDSDFPTNGYHPARGFALFDSVSVQEISNETYLDFRADANEADGLAVASDNFLIRDNNEAILTTGESSIKNPSFATVYEGWTQEDETSSAAIDVIDADNFHGWQENNKEYLKTNPYAPLSDITPNSHESNILKISSKSAVREVFGSLTSDAFKIDRHAYYRVSVWVNTKDVDSGTPSVSIISDEDNEEKDVAITAFDTPTSGSWRGNWVEASFYIQGSTFKDRTVRLKLSGGTSDAKMVGAVYFDNISIMRLTSEQYAANSASGTTVTFAGAATTVIGNGNFDTVASGFNTYPLNADSWVVKTEDAKSIHGIVPIDETSFETYSNLYWNSVQAPKTAPDSNPDNLLMIWNKEKTHTSYTSADFTLDASASKTITVRLNTQLTSGKAYVKLLSGTDTVSELKDLDTHGVWKDYKFVLNGDTTAHTLKIVIGLGEDSTQDSLKAQGYLFVDTADMADKVATDVASDTVKVITYAPDMFDIFSGEGAIKTPAMWTKNVGNNADATTAVTGIVDMQSHDFDSYPNVNISEMFANHNSRYAMLLHSAEKTAVGFTQKLALQYTADTYVKVSVRAKTRGFAKGEGIRIVLDGTHYFDNVNTQYPKRITDEMTSEYVPHVDADGKEYMVYEGWQEYSFYVNVGSATATHNLSIWLGNADKISEHRAGTVLIDQVTVTTVDETSYSEATANVDSDDESEVPDNVVRVILGETADDGTDGDEGEDTTTPGGCANTSMWLVPSLMFGIAILIAIVGFSIRKFAARPKKAKPDTSLPSYDRGRKIDLSKDKKELEPEQVHEKLFESDFEVIPYNEHDDGATEESTATAENEVTASADAAETSTETEQSVTESEKAEASSEEAVTDANADIDKDAAVATVETAEPIAEVEKIETVEKPSIEVERKKDSDKKPFDSFDD